jgi:hypothetical protein
MVLKRGMRFEHARQITGSPKAGTAQPVVMRITRVTRTGVYYCCDADGLGRWVIEPERMHAVVGRWL